MHTIGSMNRRSFLGLGAAVGASIVLPPFRGVAAAAVGDPATVGQWTAPFDIGGQAIHAAMMHNGDVLFFSYVEGNPTVDHTSYVGTWNYRTNQVREANYTYHRDIFCTGMNVLPDGRLFVAGGHDHNTGKRSDPKGVAETDTYDPLTRIWTPGPIMNEKRWYPTNVSSPDGLSYVFGGFEERGANSVTVERFDHGPRTMTTLPSSANKSLGTYPRMHVMPNGRIAKVGSGKRTWYFNRATNSWSGGPNMLFGNRALGSSVLLAGATRVLTFGGRLSSSRPSTRTAEVLDLTAATPAWRSTGSMTFARSHANGVILPDGTVLAVGGGASGTETGPVRSAEMYDPVTGRWTPMAEQVAGRMYHSTALLLPDGRVFSGGQAGPFAKTAEIFSPPYLFRGARPVATSAPGTVARGASLTITSPDAADVRSVALVRAGSVTHQVNTDQRHLPLSFGVNGDVITAQVPSNTALMPPSYYMLFLVNNAGVPSHATWVKVT
jgi:hypothetical protein